MADRTHIKAGIEYDYRVTLINNDTPNKGEVFNFNPNMIMELSIADNFFQWYSNGYMVFNNSMEVLERGDEKKKQGFKFRSDGYDVLIVSILPKGADEKKYLLEYKFAVYDFEDIQTTDNTAKYKKLYFWELDYQLMIDRNLAWSSFNANPDLKNKKKDELFQLTNYERGVEGDKLLKYFLESVCGFKDRIDKENWKPCAKEHKIYYTSPSQNFLDDDLECILPQCIADDQSDYSTMIFRKERATQRKKNGKFSLLSLKDYFEKAKPDQFMIENYYLQSPGTNLVTMRSPNVNDDMRENVILSYQYAQAAGIDNSKAYQIKPQSFYSHGSGQFNWDATWNTPLIAKKHVAKEMVDKLKKKGSPEEITLATLNKWRKDESYTLNPENSTCYNRFGRLASGRNKIIDAMLLLNDTITFDVYGLTKRGAGRFVGIDLLAGENDVDFDNRLCGQWFVVGVTHTFTDANYVNSLTCVKVHTYENKKPIKEDLDPSELNKDGYPD